MLDRPTVDSFQRWANAVGSDSYLRGNVLSFCKDSATFTPPNNQARFTNTTLTFQLATFNNSLNGSAQVSYSNYAAPIASWFELGLEAIRIK